MMGLRSSPKPTLQGCNISVVAGTLQPFILLDISDCKTVKEIQEKVMDWTDYYNNERYQWGLAKLAPREYYTYVTTGKYPLEIPKPKGFR